MMGASGVDRFSKNRVSSQTLVLNPILFRKQVRMRKALGRVGAISTSLWVNGVSLIFPWQGHQFTGGRGPSRHLSRSRWKW
jgi:hypothetical protein